MRQGRASSHLRRPEGKREKEPVFITPPHLFFGKYPGSLSFLALSPRRAHKQADPHPDSINHDNTNVRDRLGHNPVGAAKGPLIGVISF
jgi:hypothetical protein